MNFGCIARACSVTLTLWMPCYLAGCASYKDSSATVSYPPASFSKMTRSLDKFSAQHSLARMPSSPVPQYLGGFWAPNIRYQDVTQRGIELAAYDLKRSAEVHLRNVGRFHLSAARRFDDLESALRLHLEGEYGRNVQFHPSKGRSSQ